MLASPAKECEAESSSVPLDLTATYRPSKVGVASLASMASSREGGNGAEMTES